MNKNLAKWAKENSPIILQEVLATSKNAAKKKFKTSEYAINLALYYSGEINFVTPSILKQIKHIKPGKKDLITPLKDPKVGMEAIVELATEYTKLEGEFAALLDCYNKVVSENTFLKQQIQLSKESDFIDRYGKAMTAIARASQG